MTCRHHSKKKKDICYASDLVGYVIEVIEREIVKQF